MRRRKGLLLLWVQMASAVLLLLAGSALALTASAARGEARAEETAEMTLLAEEAVETMKYDARLGGEAAVPEGAERNGRRYAVEVRREAVLVEGVPCEAAAVTVTAADGAALTFRTLLGPAAEETEETEGEP